MTKILQSFVLALSLFKFEQGDALMNVEEELSITAHKTEQFKKILDLLLEKAEVIDEQYDLFGKKLLLIEKEQSLYGEFVTFLNDIIDGPNSEHHPEAKVLAELFEDNLDAIDKVHKQIEEDLEFTKMLKERSLRSLSVTKMFIQVLSDEIPAIEALAEGE